MKIAITGSQPTLNSPLDPRFGRCAYFIFISEDSQWEALENPGAGASGGAGALAAQLLSRR